MKPYSKITLMSLLLLSFSCQSTKHSSMEKTLEWEGREVTQKEYDSLLNAYTREFVESYFSKDSIQRSP